MTWKQVQCLNLAGGSKERSLVKVNRAGEGHTVPSKTCIEYTSSCTVSPIPSFFPESLVLARHLEWAGNCRYTGEWCY